MVKTHMDKDGQKKELHRRSMEIILKDIVNIVKTITVDKPTTTATSGLAQDLKVMTDNVDNMKANLTAEEIIDKALTSMSDNDLCQLIGIFDTKRRIRTEERLLQLAHVCMPDLVKLNVDEEHIAHTRHVLVNFVVDTFTATFTTEKNGTASYNNLDFVKKVDNNIAYRKALKDMTSKTTTTLMTPSSESTCTIS